jgi:hypothetical protein
MSRITALLGAFVAIILAAPAQANPLDPHVPDITRNNCPGGRGGFGIVYCDGEHYPDGSFWHQIMGYNSISGDLQCVRDDGSMLPPKDPTGCQQGTQQMHQSYHMGYTLAGMR